MQALLYLDRARRLAPRDANLLNSLGNLQKRMGEWERAAATFDAAIAAAPDHANAHYNKGTVLEGLRRFDEASTAYARAIELEPQFEEALGRLSYLAAMRGEYDVAYDYGTRAIARHPEAFPTALQLAQFAQLRGDHAVAKRFAHRLLSQAPNNTLALAVAAAAEIALGEADTASAHIHALLAGETGNKARAYDLIGRLEEKRGNVQAAFAAFAQSQDELRREYERTHPNTEDRTYAERVARMLEYFSDAPAAQWRAKPFGKPAIADGTADHIFLVGFPRSGTTLLEKSLAANPQIVTLEEEETFAGPNRDFFIPKEGFARLATLTDEVLEPYRDAYWRVWRGATPQTAGKIVIDKMPLNSLMLPFVAKLFPDAKVVFALRDPRDVVLSCFKQQFELTPAMYEFTRLDTTARLYDLTMRLAESYREKLGLAILDTRYEDMIADFDAATRRICDFIGAGWTEAMRNAQGVQRERLVRTPSAQQIARGLYDGSGQWRRYKTEMASVLPILAPWVEKFGYPKD